MVAVPCTSGQPDYRWPMCWCWSPKISY